MLTMDRSMEQLSIESHNIFLYISKPLQYRKILIGDLSIIIFYVLFFSISTYV